MGLKSGTNLFTMEEFETTVTGVIQETHDVKTFRLERPKGLRFISGQYAMIALPGEPSLDGETRPFTFSSSPLEEKYVDFTIKLMGDFTRKMFALRGGERIILKGPLGEELKVDESVKEDLGLIAGGSGITPFISAIRYAIASGMTNKISLFYANRNEEDIIFHEELDRLMGSRIEVIYCLSDGVPEGWTGEQGRIDKEMIVRHVKEPGKKRWLLCGPPGMIKAMRNVLKNINVADDMIMEEPWQIPGKHDR